MVIALFEGPIWLRLKREGWKTVKYKTLPTGAIMAYMVQEKRAA